MSAEKPQNAALNPTFSKLRSSILIAHCHLVQPTDDRSFDGPCKQKQTRSMDVLTPTGQGLRAEKASGRRRDLTQPKDCFGQLYEVSSGDLAWFASDEIA